MTTPFQDHIITIEGEDFGITPIPATKGLGYMRRLTKLLGPSITALFSAADEESSVEMDGLQKAVNLLVENMDKEDVTQLIIELIRTVHKNGQSINFDMEFTGNYQKLFLILAEVLKVNFGSLFQLSAINF